MNREIKFRMWDKKDKKMRKVESIGFGELNHYENPVVNGVGYDCINDKEIMVHRDFPHFELMQYTGFKDYHCKDIYEGDIVSFFNDEDYIIKPGYAEVIFENGAFCLKHFKYGTECLGNFDIDDMNISVLGNIYENPKLLKESEK